MHITPCLLLKLRASYAIDKAIFKMNDDENKYLTFLVVNKIT